MAEKKKTKSQIWFEANVCENRKELLEIGDLSNRMLYDKISLGISNPMTTIAAYGTIFDSILKFIRKQEADWDSFSLDIADRLEIGYTTTESEDDEKPGNFMVYMRHIPNEGNNKDTSLDEDETSTISLCTQWNAANIRVQADAIREISPMAKKELADIINIKTDSSEFIMPMFCIIHAQIINYIRLKRVEEGKSQYELNVAGLYTAGIRETDQAEEEVYMIPSIYMKLALKDDAKATGI